MLINVLCRFLKNKEFQFEFESLFLKKPTLDPEIFAHCWSISNFPFPKNILGKSTRDSASWIFLKTSQHRKCKVTDNLLLAPRRRLLCVFLVLLDLSAALWHHKSQIPSWQTGRTDCWIELCCWFWKNLIYPTELNLYSAESDKLWIGSNVSVMAAVSIEAMKHIWGSFSSRFISRKRSACQALQEWIAEKKNPSDFAKSGLRSLKEPLALWEAEGKKGKPRQARDAPCTSRTSPALRCGTDWVRGGC